MTPDTSAPPAESTVKEQALREREVLEAELNRMQRNFGVRVAERTAALRKTNEQLYNEILERKKAERALRATERKYRGFFENSVEGAYQSTAEGQYLSINPALARLYGYTTAAEMMAAVGNIARDIYVDAAMRQKFREMIERDGEVRNLEYQVRQRDGEVIWISESARVARNRRGQVVYYEGTIRNINSRKRAEAEAARLEQQLLQLQKMEAIGTLASGIAHDFNNILGGIMGYVELAQDDLPPGSSSASHLQEVMGALHRAKQVVRQILTFSRQSPPQRQRIRLGMIVEEVVHLLRATLPSTITIKQEITADQDETIADPAQIHQVLLNLGTNASHAMATKGGSLLVRLESVNLGDPGPAPVLVLASGRYLKLSVQDTGHGIRPEILRRIFEPFFTTKPVGEGTGLGLSVVHGIVKGHGGDIHVESTPATGTTFTVYLPVAGNGRKKG
jgi:two-component system, cell cycle sensor histidine kinase and response regulator CckA